jgi:hypothetical protein
MVDHMFIVGFVGKEKSKMPKKGTHGTHLKVSCYKNISHYRGLLCYAAGFIDADGSIIIERRKDPRSTHKINHAPKIQAYCSRKEPLEYLLHIFGGIIITDIREGKYYRAKFNSRATMYVWSVRGERATKVANYLIPYLKVKKAQAILISNFRLYAVWKNLGLNASLSDEEFQRREEMYQECKRLNRLNYTYPESELVTV